MEMSQRHLNSLKARRQPGPLQPKERNRTRAMNYLSCKQAVQSLKRGKAVGAKSKWTFEGIRRLPSAMRGETGPEPSRTTDASAQQI
eukprot:CAMPEP_0206428612 /NCGR_PEP_ID=MMETSP0324_2-20121206/5771_1 /ASSEMBLY_ACC=CAM_ASM_000836 /TAXON_ID=2866 /ORGANISM="Crypthecodinium cohnii, Strain Seligo" /LENGTH=86 /DNA_ID=CAMNT_0053894179 /DNA_START=387 /DNA_END=644 /DNA_ORIENTATION=-